MAGTKKNTTEYAANAMRAAIIGAHNTNNKKAITKDDAIKSGTTVERFEQWVLLVSNLQEAVDAYVFAKHSRTVAEEDKAVLRSKICPLWYKVAQTGKETGKEAQSIWVCEHDIDSLVGYNEQFVRTIKGTQQATQTATLFRKAVESLLGCRIADNGVLSIADRDTLDNFYKAERNMQSAEKSLNGYTDNDGKHINGILDDIKDIQSKISTSENMLKGLGLSDEDIAKNELLAGMRLALKNLEEAKGTTSKRLTEATAEYEKLKPEAEAVEAKLSMPTV